MTEQEHITAIQSLLRGRHANALLRIPSMYQRTWDHCLVRWHIAEVRRKRGK